MCYCRARKPICSERKSVSLHTVSSQCHWMKPVTLSTFINHYGSSEQGHWLFWGGTKSKNNSVKITWPSSLWYLQVVLSGHIVFQAARAGILVQTRFEGFQGSRWRRRILSVRQLWTVRFSCNKELSKLYLVSPNYVFHNIWEKWVDLKPRLTHTIVKGTFWILPV